MDRYALEKKLNFIEEYKKAINASTGSNFDPNSNVTVKNIATLQTELMKKDFIDVNRALMEKYIKEKYGEELAEQYRVDLKHHIIYSHDETGLAPYCVAISMYPFLLNGLKDLGGVALPPNHADSFIGCLINLVPLIAGQYLGAVAIPEFIPYFDYFLRKDFGNNYIYHLDEPVVIYGKRKETLRDRITDWFQQFVYSINMPASARNYQSCFVNISYFDKYYFESLFKGFFFPDGEVPCWETTKELQKMFMKWFNKERTKAILTFPVETMNLLWDKDTKKYKDEEMADFTAEMWAEGHSFFLYNSDSADALSSCCRLKNAIEENIFSYTLGAGGVETGSKKVITLNINRIVQDWYNNEFNKLYKRNKKTLPQYIEEVTSRVHRYLEAWNAWLWDLYNSDMLTVYKAGFIDLDKQYLTIGFNGFIEGAEFLKQCEVLPGEYKGIDTHPDNKAYKQFAKDILVTIKELNKKDRTDHCKFNTEQVPAENLGIKFYNWDKRDGYWVPKERNIYNSYFYPVEDTTYDPITKMMLQGEDFIGCLDGGSAYHCNLSEHLSKEQYRKLMDIAIKAGCSYFTFNIPGTRCKECGHIDKRYLNVCPECGSTDLIYHTRVIGYMKEVSSWPEGRQIEFGKRFFWKND